MQTSEKAFLEMIMFGEQHWTEVRPVWQLLSSIAKGRKYGELIALTDSEEEIFRRIRMLAPDIYKK